MPKTTKRIADALKTVKGVLERADLTPTPLDDGTGYEAHFANDGPEVRAWASVFEEEKFVFYFEFAQKPLRKAIRSTMEFITRANFDLVMGNFEMDIDGGVVRYKASLDFSGMDLSALLVRNLMLSAIYCIETYSSALQAVMNGSKNAEEAVDQAEASA
jgi:hypothetical protein